MTPSKPADDTDLTSEEGAVAVLQTSEAKKSQLDFLQHAKRDLSDEELSVPAVRRFLIADIDRLTEENASLQKFRDTYHQVDKECEILKHRVENKRTRTILDSAFLATGSAGIGAAPAYISISSYGWVFFGLSLMIVALSIYRSFR